MEQSVEPHKLAVLHDSPSVSAMVCQHHNQFTQSPTKENLQQHQIPVLCQRSKATPLARHYNQLSRTKTTRCLPIIRVQACHQGHGDIATTSQRQPIMKASGMAMTCVTARL